MMSFSIDGDSFKDSLKNQAHVNFDMNSSFLKAFQKKSFYEIQLAGPVFIHFLGYFRKKSLMSNLLVFFSHQSILLIFTHAAENIYYIITFMYISVFLLIPEENERRKQGIYTQILPINAKKI